MESTQKKKFTKNEKLLRVQCQLFHRILFYLQYVFVNDFI